MNTTPLPFSVIFGGRISVVGITKPARMQTRQTISVR